MRHTTWISAFTPFSAFTRFHRPCPPFRLDPPQVVCPAGRYCTMISLARRISICRSHALTVYPVTSQATCLSTFTSKFDDVDIPDVPFTDFILSRCADYGDKPAFINGITGDRITYRELPDRVASAASALHSRGFRRCAKWCCSAHHACLLNVLQWKCVGHPHAELPRVWRRFPRSSCCGRRLHNFKPSVHSARVASPVRNSAVLRWATARITHECSQAG